MEQNKINKAKTNRSKINKIKIQKTKIQKNFFQFLSLILFAVLLVTCFSACGAGDAGAKNVASGSSANDEKKLSIVTTIFPEYDWVREILGDSADYAELTMLLDRGVDLHSYQPTAQDIMKISMCDLFIYVGGESDAWVEDALKEAVNKDMKVINLLDVLGDSAKEEEVVEGMEAEEEEEHSGEAEEDSGSEEETEYDEHVWLSLKNTEVLTRAVADELKALDPDHADEYENNLSAYQEKLEALDKEFQLAADSAWTKTLLFGDRFPFRYLVDDYGLEYYAAFVGCSAETEASFETVTFLAKKADELGLKSICTIEGSDGKIANTIKENTASKNQEIISFDSLQSCTMEDVEAGTTYLAVMEKNLEALKKALN